MAELRIICAVSPTRRWLLTLALPFVFAGGYFVFDYAPSFLEDAYDDFLGPFLLTYWIGLLFSNMYFVLVEDLKGEGAGPGTIALMAGGLALLFFLAGGGPSVIWRDPWMFGITVMPGIDIAWPYIRDRLHAGNRTAVTEAGGGEYHDEP
jgi:predicted MFS family arabinose efflux permease